MLLLLLLLLLSSSLLLLLLLWVAHGFCDYIPLLFQHKEGGLQVLPVSVRLLSRFSKDIRLTSDSTLGQL